MITAWLSAAIALALIHQDAEFTDADFRIADIRARLLYEETGGLSVDISDNEEFWAFNTIIGEGSALENANDLLVTAVVRGPGEHNSETPLVLTVTDRQGRTLATRTIVAPFLEAETHRSLFVPGVGCAGTLALSARFGASVRQEEITLGCGE